MSVWIMKKHALGISNSLHIQLCNLLWRLFDASPKSIKATDGASGYMIENLISSHVGFSASS